jgi:hypothetical protein
MKNDIKDLLDLVKNYDPMPIEYGALEDDQSETILIPTDTDITVSCKDRRLHVWANTPKHIIDYVRNIMG